MVWTGMCEGMKIKFVCVCDPDYYVCQISTASLCFYTQEAIWSFETQGSNAPPLPLTLPQMT